MWFRPSELDSHFILDVVFDFLANALNNGESIFEFRLQSFWLMDQNFTKEDEVIHDIVDQCND